MHFTDTAADTADTQADGTVRDFKGAGVISVDRKTGRVSTGASELVELETADEVIIFFWIFSELGLQFSWDKVIIINVMRLLAAK